MRRAGSMIRPFVRRIASEGRNPALTSVSRRTEGRCVGEGRLAAHQLGQHAAGRRPERVAVMAVPEMHPQSLVLRRRSHDRQHVGHAGANAAPGFGFDRVPRSTSRRAACSARSSWTRLRQPFRSHQFGAGRNPQSLRHRRHGVGELRIVQRQIEPAAAAEMPVVATLAHHRKTIVESVAGDRETMDPATPRPPRQRSRPLFD